MKRRKRYEYSFSALFCMSDNTWVERETWMSLMSYEEPGQEVTAYAIAVAKDDFQDLMKSDRDGIYCQGVAISWFADFAAKDLKKKMTKDGSIYLD